MILDFIFFLLHSATLSCLNLIKFYQGNIDNLIVESKVLVKNDVKYDYLKMLNNSF